MERGLKFILNDFIYKYQSMMASMGPPRGSVELKQVLISVSYTETDQLFTCKNITAQLSRIFLLVFI